MERNMPKLCRYSDSTTIRPATAGEIRESLEASRHDGGAGVIEVDGEPCYVEGESAHTPTPWILDSEEYPNSNDYCLRSVNGGDDPRIARILMDAPELGIGEQEENAQFIIRAVNSHARLVDENERLRNVLMEKALSNTRLREALLECVAWMDAPHRASSLQGAILIDARAALAASAGAT